jgi:hypothetical protein
MLLPEEHVAETWTYSKGSAFRAMISGSSAVTTAWRVLRLRMEERPADMEGSCEYIE